MDKRPRHPRTSLTSESRLPADPGVYAIYRDGERLYVGKAGSLRSRLWNNHLRVGVSMTNSAFRRNVAEHLGIATAADIKARRCSPTAVDAKRIGEFVETTKFAWIVCESEADAVALETRLKAEFKPPLTKR